MDEEIRKVNITMKESDYKSIVVEGTERENSQRNVITFSASNGKKDGSRGTCQGDPEIDQH